MPFVPTEGLGIAVGAGTTGDCVNASVENKIEKVTRRPRTLFTVKPSLSVFKTFIILIKNYIKAMNIRLGRTGRRPLHPIGVV